MSLLSLLITLAFFLAPDATHVALAAPSIFHDIVDDEPPVLTVRIVVVGTTAFITFIVLAICFFLLAQRHTPRRRHVPGTRRQNALRIRLPHILTDTMLAERAFVRSITAGALVVGSNQLAPVAAPPTARRSGHIRVYEGSTSSVSLLSSLESDVTDFSFNGTGLRA